MPYDSVATQANVTYQIFQPAQPIPEEDIPTAKRAEEKVVSVPAAGGPGLIFAEPEELRALAPILDKFNAQGVVIPDYVFLEFVSTSKDFDCLISDIELSDPTDTESYRTTIQHLVQSGDPIKLREFLQQIRKPIAAVKCDYQGKGDVHTKLNGSGLITFQGDAQAVATVKGQLLPKLTAFLSQFRS